MSRTPPFHIDAAGALTAPLHVLHMLPDGRLPVPNKTQEIFVEIGTNSFDTWDVKMLPKHPGAFLVAFEPLVDKWSMMIARNSRSRIAGKLGWHNPRGVILPFAVSDKSGVVPFYISPRDGCSSLRKTHTPTRGGWTNNGFVRNACAKTVEVRQVPAVSLRTVIEEWLRGWRVSQLKIDAQGLDFALVRSVPPALLRARVQSVQMELIAPGAGALYHGQETCDEVVDYMRSIGYGRNDLDAGRCNDQRWLYFEREVIFIRDGVDSEGWLGRAHRGSTLRK